MYAKKTSVTRVNLPFDCSRAVASGVTPELSRSVRSHNYGKRETTYQGRSSGNAAFFNNSLPSFPFPFVQLVDRTYASDPSLFEDINTLNKCSSWTDPVIFADRAALSPTAGGVSRKFSWRLSLDRHTTLQRSEFRPSSFGGSASLGVVQLLSLLYLSIPCCRANGAIHAWQFSAWQSTQIHARLNESLSFDYLSGDLSPFLFPPF